MTPSLATQFDPAVLLPGDVLFYTPSSLLGDLIAVMTHGVWSHVEVAAGPGEVLAARAEGVNFYPVRLDKYLRCVRRATCLPPSGFNLIGAGVAVQDDVGQPYDTGGLFGFFNPWAKASHIHRVCSTVANHYLIGGGVRAFNPDANPNLITPTDLWITDGLNTIWKG